MNTRRLKQKNKLELLNHLTKLMKLVCLKNESRPTVQKYGISLPTFFYFTDYLRVDTALMKATRNSTLNIICVKSTFGRATIAVDAAETFL